MIRRTLECILPLLIALDILLCTVVLCLLYPFGLSAKPTGREMVSTYVGEAAVNGHRWAIRMAAVIDRVAYWLGDGPDHCRNSYRHYRLLDD